MRAEPHTGARRGGGGNVIAAGEPAHLSAQVRSVPFGQGVPIIDSSEEQRSHPGRDLPQQPGRLLARHRAVPRSGVLNERRHSFTFRFKILLRIVPTVVRFWPRATP